jgi:diacylglycerol O-acyltransferase
MMVPVNLRSKESTTELGNRISIIPVTVPLDIRDPKKLLHAVHRRTEFLKQAHAAEIVSLSAGLIGMLPSGLQAIIGPVISQLPVTPFNLVCTNIPGPQYPLYLLGHKLLRWYPYVPVGGEMSVNCAVLSYDGNIGFGFSGDVHAAPDLRRLEDFLKVSFAELREAAGIRPPRRESPKTARVKPRTKKPNTAPELLTSAQESVPLTVPAPPAQTAAAMPTTGEERVLATVA